MYTRPMGPRAIYLASALMATGLVLACMSGPADAAQKKGKKKEPQKVSNAQLHEALHVLQRTKKTLEGADHDYGGHRVEAIKAIGAAQHQLHLALGMNGKNKKAGGGGGKAGGKEPQAVSNIQLGDAIGVLERTHTFLQNADHDYGGHRAAAVRDLGAAVVQLKKALEFEKKK